MKCERCGVDRPAPANCTSIVCTECNFTDIDTEAAREFGRKWGEMLFRGMWDTRSESEILKDLMLVIRGMSNPRPSIDVQPLCPGDVVMVDGHIGVISKAVSNVNGSECNWDTHPADRYAIEFRSGTGLKHAWWRIGQIDKIVSFGPFSYLRKAYDGMQARDTKNKPCSACGGNSCGTDAWGIPTCLPFAD